MFIQDKDYNYASLRNKIFLALILCVAFPVFLSLLIKEGFNAPTPRFLDTWLMFIYFIGVHLPFSFFKAMHMPVGKFGDWFGYALPNKLGYTLIICYDFVVLYVVALFLAWEIKHMSIKGI